MDVNAWSLTRPAEHLESTIPSDYAQDRPWLWIPASPGNPDRNRISRNWRWLKHIANQELFCLRSDTDGKAIIFILLRKIIIMIKIGIIGYGYWGPNLVRNFAETPGISVASVADLDSKKLEIVQKRYPGVKTTTRFQDLLENKDIDAIAIATPVSTHFELGMAALKAGKHLWLEKPMTETSEQARKLVDEAEKRKLVLIVDHTFIYTGAVRKMADLVKSGELGQIHYYDSTRINLGLFQRDANVISDLAVHDFSILYYLLGEQPMTVNFTAVYCPCGAEDTCGDRQAGARRA
jgi:hypothetical protein